MCFIYHQYIGTNESHTHIYIYIYIYILLLLLSDLGIRTWVIVEALLLVETITLVIYTYTHTLMSVYKHNYTPLLRTPPTGNYDKQFKQYSDDEPLQTEQQHEPVAVNPFSGRQLLPLCYRHLFVNQSYV